MMWVVGYLVVAAFVCGAFWTVAWDGMEDVFAVLAALAWPLTVPIILGMRAGRRWL